MESPINLRRMKCPSRRAGWLAALAIVLLWRAGAGAAREPAQPIVLAWEEGDVAGMTSVLAVDGLEVIGFVEYHQRRRGDLLETIRVTRFRDGSSDEDHAVARVVDGTLEGVRGRSIIRDVDGGEILDWYIDVPEGRVHGFVRSGDGRKHFDESVDLPAATYWGALIFIVLKNFDKNAVDGKLVFHTVAPTPMPRAIDLELVREGETAVTRTGGRLDVVRFTLRPAIHWMIDPIIQRIAPNTECFVRASDPPATPRKLVKKPEVAPSPTRAARSARAAASVPSNQR